MGFKKLVSLICDGPCGHVIEGTEKAPVGWHKLMFTEYVKLADGEKPPAGAVMQAWLCPNCKDLVFAFLNSGRFNLNISGHGDAPERKP